MKSGNKCFMTAALLAVIFSLSFFLTACNDNPNNEPRIYIDNNFSWAHGNYEDTIEDAQKLL